MQLAQLLLDKSEELDIAPTTQLNDAHGAVAQNHSQCTPETAQFFISENH